MARFNIIVVICFYITVLCRLFLLLVLLSMIAELGGIITLNVLGQVLVESQS